MAQTRHYEIEGLSLEIPLRYDAHSGLYIEEYPDFKANPVYTPRGSPVMFIGEDRCPHAQSVDEEECQDCGSCRFFVSAGAHSWIGICRHPVRQKQGAGEG